MRLTLHPLTAILPPIRRPPMTNMFAPEPKLLKGKVVITEIPNTFGTGSVIRHVVRNTADDSVVINEMANNTDVIKKNDMTPVMSAFVKSVQNIISHGNAVRISGIGTFYIKTVQPAEEGGEETFEVSFTPAKALNEAAQKAQVEVVKPSETFPKVESVENMDTMESNGEITAGKFAAISGKRLRIAGENGDSDSDGDGGRGGGGGVPKDGTGLYLVPCDEYDNYKDDKSDWIRVEDRFIKRNVMTQVLFKVPLGIKGRYRIGISTRAPLSGSTREELLIKKAKCSVSKEAVEVSE